jgi:hypothetical protein
MNSEIIQFLIILSVLILSTMFFLKKHRGKAFDYFKKIAIYDNERFKQPKYQKYFNEKIEDSILFFEPNYSSPYAKKIVYLEEDEPFDQKPKREKILDYPFIRFFKYPIISLKNNLNFLIDVNLQRMVILSELDRENNSTLIIAGSYSFLFFAKLALIVLSLISIFYYKDDSYILFLMCIPIISLTLENILHFIKYREISIIASIFLFFLGMVIYLEIIDYSFSGHSNFIWGLSNYYNLSFDFFFNFFNMLGENILFVLLFLFFYYQLFPFIFVDITEHYVNFLKEMRIVTNNYILGKHKGKIWQKEKEK